jgi:hypothetical protein
MPAKYLFLILANTIAPCLQAENSQHILALKTTSNPIFVKPINPVFMKRRVRKIANFFAFNLLFFALYLNFIHKDKTAIAAPTSQQTTAAFSGTVLVDNPTQDLKKEEATTAVSVTQATDKTESGTALKLSIN